jgi:hypothetical protein
MKHDIILYYFKHHMRHEALKMTEWFPNGLNSIRVRLTNGEDFIFTYNGERNWCFETVDSYIVRMKGEA